jgi:hypothetical protein
MNAAANVQMGDAMKRTNGKAGMSVLIGVIVAAAIILGAVALWHSDMTGEKGNGLGQEFNYDLSKFRKTDPNLILYQELGKPISTGFKEARGVAVDKKGVIYVAGDGEIKQFNPEGTMAGEIKLAGAPRCLAVAEDGTLYVGMNDHVEVYDAQGVRLGSCPPVGDKAVISSIALAKNEFFLADAGNRVVLRCDKNGKVINRIGEKDAARNISGFVLPSPYFDLALAGDGLLRVANTGQHRIEAYTTDGDLEFTWGRFAPDIDGFCGCCNPVNFALLPDGGFVTAEKGLTRVKIYSAEGRFVGVVAGAESFAQHDTICASRGSGCNTGGLDVAADTDGRVFVLDPYTSEVRIFTRIKKE